VVVLHYGLNFCNNFGSTVQGWDFGVSIGRFKWKTRSAVWDLG